MNTKKENFLNQSVRNGTLIMLFAAIIVSASGFKTKIDKKDPFNRIIPEFTYSVEFSEKEPLDISDLLKKTESNLVAAPKDEINEQMNAIDETVAVKRTAEGVMETVADNFDNLTKIFNAHEKQNIGIFGNRMKVEFGLSKAGNVQWIRVVDTNIESLAFEEEIMTTIKTWNFKACTDCNNAIVTLPLNFGSMSLSRM